MFLRVMVLGHPGFWIKGHEIAVVGIRASPVQCGPMR